MRRVQMQWASLLVMLGLIGGIAAPIARAQDAPDVHGIDRADMDLGAEPGQDFFRFSNGGLPDRTELPATDSSYGVFSELDNQVTALLLEILNDLEAEKVILNTCRPISAS